MTQEDKELLLKDLSARLPYGVIVRYYQVLTRTTAREADGKLISDMLLDDDRRSYLDALGYGYYQLPKPYLRSMTNMTEEEKKELGEITCNYDSLHKWAVFYKSQDWLNAHHFDYRGLIEKGLALEAPEGMYKI